MKRVFYIQFALMLGCSADTFSEGDADPVADAAANLDGNPALDGDPDALSSPDADGGIGQESGWEGSIDSGDSGSDVVVSTSRRVFVTSATTTPDFGGLSQADARCESAATSASLGGTWKAWLSTTATSASSRLEHATVPYKLIGGTVIASDWTGLTSGTLQHAIDLDENGTLVSTATVATGTTASGSSATNNCNDWTSKTSSYSEAAGETTAQATDSSWTNAFSYVCSGAALVSLYCVEQP